MLIFLTGFPGSGKTFLGIQTASILKFSFVDTDSLIEKQCGESVQAIFKKHGEDFFRIKEAEVLRNISNEKNSIIAVGGGLPCFHDNMKWMNENGQTIYLEASAAFLFHRLIKEKKTRPLIEKLTDIELMIYITETLAVRRIFYEKSLIKMNAETITPSKLAHSITKKK